jgi:DUF917 family protein
MASKLDMIAMINSFKELPITDEPLKKNGEVTMSKIRCDEGIATFKNTKNVNIAFYTPFGKPPKIALELNDQANNPPYKTVVTVN